eukprot:403361015
MNGIIPNEGAINPSMMQTSEFNLVNQSVAYMCLKHTDKYVEYFCRDCNITVCIKCMFFEHNGHILSQLDEAHQFLKHTISDFENLMVMTRKINKQNNQLLTQMKDEVKKLKDTQLANLNRAFQELTKRLEAKSEVLKMQYINSYEKDLAKIEDKIRPLLKFEENLNKVETIYTDIKVIIANKNQIQLLSQMKEIISYIDKSSFELKRIFNAQDMSKNEIFISPQVKPITINCDKFIKIINGLRIDQQGNLFTEDPNSIYKAGFNHSTNKPPINQQSMNATQSRFQQLNFEEPNNQIPFNEYQSPNKLMNPLGFENGDLAQNLKDASQRLNEFNRNNKQILNSIENIQDYQNDVFDNNETQQINNLRINGQQNNTQQQQQFVRPYLAQRHQNQYSIAQVPNIDSLGTNSPNNILYQEESKRGNSNQRYQEYNMNIVNNNNNNQVQRQIQHKTYKPNAIYCFGDYDKILKFDISKNSWQSLNYHQYSAFKGEYKYTSVCRIAKTCDLLLTGGCSVSTQKASNLTFKINTEDNQYKFNKMPTMIEPRYGHSQLYLNGYVYAIGGFNHDDNQGIQPSTLQICEKYTPSDNAWSSCSDLNVPRAYAGCCPFNNESIYIFGGLNGYETTNTVEQYNTMLDKWTLLYIKLPIKIAKLGAVAIDRTSILIAGGIFGDTDMSYQYVNSVYKLDTSTQQAKWIKQNKMIGKRTLFSTIPSYHSQSGLQLFAIGGTVGDQCENLDVKSNKWSAITSYKGILPQNDLQTFSLCF